MYEIFYKYLIFNNKATLPGIGSFLVQQVPASMDFEQKKIVPPSQSVTYSPQTNAVDTYLLTSTIAKNLGVSEEEATDKLNQFAQQIASQAQQGVELPGIGKLIKNNIGEFAIEHNNNKVLQDLYINKTQAANTTLMDVYANDKQGIIRRSVIPAKISEAAVASEQQAKEDLWWVWAIVLAIMGLGSLCYYYI